MDVVKGIQRYHMKEMGLADIKNNFIVGEDGRVYVGRGWKHVGAHTDGYNQCSLGITVIDSFMDKIPRPPALDAVQHLIAYGVKMGYIHKDYILSMHRDLAPGSPSPGDRFIQLVMGRMPRCVGECRSPSDALLIPPYRPFDPPGPWWESTGKCAACPKPPGTVYCSGPHCSP
jgi:hypothetical protein